MSTLALRLLERVHGHVAWLAVAALLHPAILLRVQSRRAPWPVGLATAFVTLAATLGAVVYPGYREHVRRPLFAASSVLGWWFERKEHLAVGAVAMAWIGCAAHFAQRAGDVSPAFQPCARRAFFLATLFALVAACAGVAVSAVQSF